MIPKSHTKNRSWHRAAAGLCIGLLSALLSLPGHAQAGGLEDGLRKVGEARLRVFLWSIYDSRLYTPSGRYDERERPLRLEIDYLIDVRGEALVKRTSQEWEAMGRSHPREAAWLERLQALLPDIHKGDVLSLEIDEKEHSTFYFNGERLGRVDDPAFGQQFLDIWVSEDTTRPELRQALLGSMSDEGN
ncbi:MAG: chalcone isomerase family protein [Halieaceae bacterium]|jgi:hypothetical protein|nr:chalcone isomerase family protein [Halieaceae bacterium]